MLTEMKKTTLAFQTLIAMCGALLFCCAIAQAQDVHYNALPGTNFAQFKTYKWVEIPGGAHPNQIVGEEIQQAVDSQLAAKGLTSSTINIGSLVLDIYDVKSRQLVWTGTATKTIDPGKNEQKNLEKLQKSIAKLLKNYPPPA
jgi:hypothetical protein